MKNNGITAAFPGTTHTSDGYGVNGPEYGLTKREWLAGQALAGWLADPECGANPSRVAELVVTYVDALLTELAKEPKR